MRLEWIEDILAVLDSGSLIRASERRYLTQSAFTRRMRHIEEALGTPLLDRSRKPVTLLPGVKRLEPELRRTATQLRRLNDELRVSAGSGGRPLSFACLHAITAVFSPVIVQTLTQKEEGAVKVRSGNRDECLLQLMAGEIDFAVIYEIPEEQSPTTHKAFETVSLGADILVPVCEERLSDQITEGDIPVVRYPSDVFLGGVFDRNVAPRMPTGYRLVTKAETALTLATLQFVLSGIGMAWIPLSLAAAYLEAGQLVRMDHLFPAQDLGIVAVRLTEGAQRLDDRIWQSLIELRNLVHVSQPLPNGQTASV